MPAADLALGAHEALRHRRLGHEERAGDLGRRQAAERAQRERDLRVGRERRVTAREDELQALVGERRGVHRLLRYLGNVEQAGLRRQGPIAPDAIDGPVARGRHSHEPGFAGTPSRGQRSAAITNASCAASSARSKSCR